jgi:hypothetical protein
MRQPNHFSLTIGDIISPSPVSSDLLAGGGHGVHHRQAHRQVLYFPFNSCINTTFFSPLHAPLFLVRRFTALTQTD